MYLSLGKLLIMLIINDCADDIFNRNFLKSRTGPKLAHCPLHVNCSKEGITGPFDLFDLIELTV